MARKGATLAFEQVMLFMIGISIFLASMFIFKSYEAYYTETISRDQMMDVTDLVASNIITFSFRTGTNGSTWVSVPSEIGGEAYYIELRQDGLNVSSLTGRREVFRGLSTINQTYGLSGRFSTAGGRSQFQIFKNGDQIIIS